MKMRKAFWAWCLLLVTASAFGQNRTAAPAPAKKPAITAPPKELAKHYSDRMAAGYSGKVKLMTKVVWKNATDSIKNSKKEFDPFLLQAKSYLQAHYNDVEKVDKKSGVSRAQSVQISEEEYDNEGNLVREDNREPNDLFNITYQYTALNKDRKSISGTSNKDSKKMWTGLMNWTDSNKRSQTLAMSDLFTMTTDIYMVGENSRSFKSMLKLKELFVLEAELNRIEAEPDHEIWVHVEIYKDLRFDSLAATTDTITHFIMARDAHNNVIKERVTHSIPAQPAQFIRSRFEYF